MLPLPYAPNIDVDAERLRNVDREAARPAIDVGAGLAQGIATGMTMQKALQEDNKKAAAELFQKEYLDKGNEGIAKMVAEAGDAAKGFPVQAYQIPAGTPPDKARDMVLLAAKDLTGYREKAKADKINSDVSAAAKDPTKTSTDLAAITGDAPTIIGAKQKEEERAGKALEKDAERALREQIKKDDRSWDKTMATFRAGLEREAKAGKATTQIADDLAELKTLNEKRAKYAVKEFLTDVDKIEYADVVRQGSILKERIARAKKDGAVAPKDDGTVDQSAEDARTAIANGAPADAVYDRFKSLSGKRHPDDKRK